MDNQNSQDISQNNQSNNNFAADYTQADQVQATPMAENIQMADTMAEVEVVEQQPLTQVDETGAPMTTDSSSSGSSSSDNIVSGDLSNDTSDPASQPADDTPATDAIVDASGDDAPDSTDIDSLTGGDSDGEQMSADGSFGMMGPDL